MESLAGLRLPEGGFQRTAPPEIFIPSGVTFPNGPPERTSNQANTGTAAEFYHETASTPGALPWQWKGMRH
jgi:hypothetical protein